MPLPYKTLVLCFDGTWNNLSSRTNVARFYSEVADVSSGCPDQIKFYDEGVGTGKWDKIRGGSFGLGLDDNIRGGYAWLASVYQSEADKDAGGKVLVEPPAASLTRKSNGDLLGAKGPSGGGQFLAGSDIYIIGFSRGAYTARSLGGLINYLGIPRMVPGSLEKKVPLSEHPRIKQAWELYLRRPQSEVRDRIRDNKATAQELDEVRRHDEEADAFRADHSRFPVRIHFMGVWDTVGTLGVPPVFGAWNNPLNRKYRFHDTTLGESIRHAYHAVAIDEHRLPYTATLWTGNRKPTTESVEQRWFPGAHADVGGGYADDLLHELPLSWLAKKAASWRLEFVNDRHIEVRDGTIPASIAMAPASFDLDGTEYLSPVHDSYSEFLGGVYKVLRWLRGGRVYRRILVPGDSLEEKIDESAFEKWRKDLSYRPRNLAQAGRAEVSYNIASLDPLGWGQPR